MALGMILAFIPFLIIKYKTKAEKKIYYNKQLIKSKLYNELIVSKNAITKVKCKKFRFVFYSTLIVFLQSLLTILFTNYFVYNFWIFDIIFMSLFSFLFLKTKYYKHQFISMISIVILGLGLNIITYFKYVNIDDTEDKLNILNLFIQFISEIFYSLIIILWKYNMEKNYCNPYELCFLEGVFEFIINSICLIIFCRFELSANGIQHPDNLKKYFNEYDYNDLIICLSEIIVSFTFNISIILTCDYFTPIHILIINIINDSTLFFRIDSNLALYILGSLFLILILFMLLVFIEVIEINIFNLSYNTKRNIELRSKTDTSVDIDSINFPEEEPELNEVKELDDLSSNSIY